MSDLAQPSLGNMPVAPAATGAAPLDDVMLAMDVVDTLRHNQDLATREINESQREAQLIERLRDIYRQQGIEVSDQILKEGVAALRESRFVYTPPKPSFATLLARLYVGRKRWAPPLSALLLVLVVGLGGYFLAYQPFQQSQAEAARVELTEKLPAEMDALYQSIFNETKVQQAANDAEALRERGKTAAQDGDRPGAERAVAQLTALRDTLRQEYTLRIVNRPDVQSGVWRFPENNTAATNYYVVVEALGPDGKALSLPIANEENGRTETVSLWGIRVPEAVYNSVAADKRDDGIIQRNVVGVKQYGFLAVDYAVPVLGGSITRW